MAKTVADGLARINLNEIMRAEGFSSLCKGTIDINGRMFGDFLIQLEGEEPHLIFDYGDGYQLYSKIISIPVHFGGVRRYLECPYGNYGNRCKKRVNTLYYLHDIGFACRHCHDLTYESRLTNKGNSYLDRSMEYYTLYHAIKNAEEKIKRRHYRGKPTKEMQKIMRMEARLSRYTSASFDYQDGDTKWSQKLFERIQVQKNL